MKRRVTTSRLGTVLLAAALGVAGAGLAPATATAAPVAVVVTAGSADLAAHAVDGAGGEVTASLEFLGGVAATLPSAAVATLEARPGIAVTPDEVVELAETDLATAIGPDHITDQDQLASMSLPEHWTPASGTGVGVALLDTGVADVPELSGRIVRGPDLSGDGDGIDHHGHGTFMAGLIAADGRVRDDAEPRFGVAPGAHIVSVKLAGRDGRTTMSRVLEGIGWAITNQDEHGIRVLSLSLGVATNRAPQADPLAMAVDAAWASGLTVVTASGNEGGQVTSPGRSSWVVTVGATDTGGTSTTDDDTVPAWSGAGKVTGTDRPDVLAPGVSTVSLRVPGSRIDEDHPEARVGEHQFRGSGTSMSTALVAGAAAVLTEMRPFATPDDIKGALKSTTKAIPDSRAGAIDLAAADAAEADTAWRQRHQIGDQALGAGRQAMPWNRTDAPPASVTWERVRWLDDQWQRVRWLDGQWQRVRWLEDDWARVRWLEDGFTRVRWLDGEWQRVRWLDGQWQRVRWLDADLARVRWLESHFTRVRWLDGDWARVRWLDLTATADGGVETPAAFDRSADPTRTPGVEAPGRRNGKGNSGDTAGPADRP